MAKLTREYAEELVSRSYELREESQELLLHSQASLLIAGRTRRALQEICNEAKKLCPG